MEPGNATHMTTATRKTGEFCRINVLTPQPSQAREFFARLLGWTYSELPGMGHAVQAGGCEIGDLCDLVHSSTPRGTPPHIGLVLEVESTEAACKQVHALGGKASPAFDLMDQGRMAVCVDPSGAEFDVWEPKQGPGPEVDRGLHGAPSWFELSTNDVERAAAFYAGVF